MGEEELGKEDILKIFYTTPGGLDRINAVIDARLAEGRTRSITLFEKFIRARLEVNPKVLKMPNSDITAVEAVYLSQYPGVREVEILDLRQNHFGDVGLDALVNSPHLKNLRALDLRNNQITRVGLESLARADTLAHLETLDLRLNKVGKRWENKLRASEKLPALATVRVV
jgi:Ran GTPase-activating protein (RanGAP) involved in mRNA processing and transport